MQLYELRQNQSLPLELKVRKSQLRIREWYDHWDGDVYVSFSGGKDSTSFCIWYALCTRTCRQPM